MNLIKNKFIIIVLLGVALLLSACGTINIGMESSEDTLIIDENEPEISTDVVETPEVTPEMTKEFVPEETPADPTQESPQYWDEAEDPRTGVRFAVPCFWEYEIPQDETGILGAFSLRNYPYSFAESFPRGVGVFEAGGIKIDVLYFDYVDWNLLPYSSPRDLAMAMYSEENTETILSFIEESNFNGQPVLRVVTESTFGSGVSYWYDLSPENVLVLGLTPLEADGSDDVQAILDSVALTPEMPFQLPVIDPALPPQGVDAECLSGIEYPVDSGYFKGTLDCATTDIASLDYAACNVVDGIHSGNLSALLSLMVDPFIIGYWGSESRSGTPEEIIEELRQYHLPPDTSKLTFTNERAKFPPLEGMPPEDMFGPDVTIAEIIYSEGWGVDGLGSALIYISQDEAGRYYWYGLVVSTQRFDKR